MIDAPVQAEPISEVDRLRQEIADLISSGIVEIAARNPSVLEYMRHWEGRAEKAEARVRELEDRLQPFAIVGDSVMGLLTKPDHAGIFGHDDAVLTYGDFRRARKALGGSNE